MNKLYSELSNSIKKSSHILITAHQFPDLDAIGSCLGLAGFIRQFDIKTTIWLGDVKHDDISFLKGHESIITDLGSLETSPDLLIFLDSPHPSRVFNHELLDQFKDIHQINIDHHQDNSHFANLNIVEEISSVGELIHKIATANNWAFTADIANYLYAAIVYDTGRFMFQNTTASTLAAANDLILKGAQHYQLNLAIFENKSIESFRLYKTLIDNININDDHGYVYSSVPQSMAHLPDKSIDFIRELSGYQIFLIFKELNHNTIKISLRSKNDFDVATFSHPFGGGGHKNAAGILLKKQTLKQAHDTLTQALNNALNPL